MHSRKTIFALIGSALFAMAFLIVRPIPSPSDSNYETISGMVSEISLKGGPNDILLTIEGDSRFFYINRGAEHLDFTLLEAATADKLITVYYSNHWTPLDPKNQSRHIYALEVNGNRVYSEF